MTPEELAEFQAEFKAVDLHNRQQVKRWFLDYPELTLPERAVISGMSEIWIKKLKRSLKLSKVKIIETTFGLRIVNRIQPKKLILNPPIENLEEWILYQYIEKERSITELSLATNRSRTHIRTILRNNMVQFNKSNINPYKTREWLTEHFVSQKLSYRQCGKLAGVSRSTIQAWLSHFQIKNRDKFEAAHGLLDKKVNKPINSQPPCGQT